MKKMSKLNLFLLTFLLISCFSVKSQTTYFYKSGSPDPTAATSWNTALDGSGTNA